MRDLQFVAAIAATGALTGAAQRLGVSHATAFRRLEAFEARLGVKLFERSAGRYVPTLAGEELAQAGAEIERQATESLLKVAGQDLRPTGHVRVTTTDSFANGLIAPMAQSCRSLHPGILLQVVVSNDFYDLSKRDADIAVRPTKSPPEHLIGKKIGNLAMAVYGAARYLQRRPGKDLAAHEWIAVDDSMPHTVSLRWLARFKPLDEVAYRTNSFIGLAHACSAGAGLAVLPCFIGDRQPALRRVTGPIEECTNDVWVLMHPDLRNSARIKAVFHALDQELSRAAPLLAGRQPRFVRR
ncbi:MAG: LysR family transcriptional regulator [Rhodanobacteraceae bacterium]|nr:LysR family transcriptional regulator [Rhodanobacteraceae bacterium]